jgi:PAS domain S-box-containing protein
MINFKNIFSFDYHPKLLEILTALTLLGVFAANIVSPVLMAYILYDVVPHFQIYIWIFLHFLVFLGRMFLTKKLDYFLKIKSENCTKYLQKIFMLTTITAILYSIAVWVSLFYYNASDLQVFTIAVIIVSLSAGAIATLVSIYLLYALYVTFTMIPLITMLLYHGGEMFSLFAFVLIIFMITILNAAYRQYSVLKNSISLEETFQTIYEKALDGIVLIQNNRFKDCNEAIVQMFQYDSKEEVLNTHLSNLMPERQLDGSSSVKKMLQFSKLTYENGSSSFEWLYKKRNGELFCTEVSLTKIYLDGEELLLGSWRDITDRKKLEEEKEVAKNEIEQLNQSLGSRIKLEVDNNRKKDQLMLQQSRLAQMGEMISMIAHQWRQPLAAISATSATIELKASINKLDKDDIQQKAHAISDYSQHLSRTIDDFRGFFKPNKEKTETTYDEIIDSVLQIMEASLKNKNIHLIMNLNCHDIFSTYPGEIKQVILNLITNAEEALLEAIVEDPYITIETYVKEDQYILEVSDNAGGIAEKNIEYIFDPYFSTKKAKDGTGLGLYMSKMIIEDHCDGKLSVSNNENGAVFKLVLENKKI